MPQEPREPGRDRGAISRPGEELGYVINVLVREFPGMPRPQIVDVVETSKVEIAPSIDTQDVLTRARERLRAIAGKEPTIGPAHPASAQPLHQARKTGPSKTPS